jgi:hypothetical protein
MAGSFDMIPLSMEEMMAQDPTLVVDGVDHEANGPTPDPFERYGEPLPSNWIPLYKKPLRTPTRKLRIACIGAGISAMNLAHKIYHEWKDVLEAHIELVIYEANESIGGTWLVNTYPGVACDVPGQSATLLIVEGTPFLMLQCSTYLHVPVRAESGLERLLRLW